MNFFLVYTKQKKNITIDDDVELVKTGFNKLLIFLTPSIYFLSQKMYIESGASLILLLILNKVLSILSLTSEVIFIANLMLYAIPFAVLSENIEENFLIRNNYILRDIIAAENEDGAIKIFFTKKFNYL